MNKYQHFENEIKGFLSAEQIISDPLRTLAYGTDASFYRLIPKVVVLARTEQDVVNVLRAARRLKIATTFRAAGTSLSGQAISDSVLIKLQGWKAHAVLDKGNKISLQPGVIGAHANRYLAPYQRKIGPDPASINAAMIGGIAANNASGMCCGTAQNSYRTLASMRVVLADGTVLDTANDHSKAAFAHSHKNLLDALSRLRQSVLNRPELEARIRHKFRIKNTTGYSLNALVDFDDPIDILQHLMIGSEGTLGFISEITYHTVTEHEHKASALMLFNDIETCCQAVSALKQAPVAAVELMDRTALRSIEHKDGVPECIRSLPENAAALLVETRANKHDILQQQITRILETLSPFESAQPLSFSEEPSVCQAYWNIRKGLFPAVGAMRAIGTTVIIEDVAFDVAQLANAVQDLQDIFKRYHYDEALIFGHALEGNLHFVFTQDFSTPAELERYSGLMDDVASLVTQKYDGSLKAEHGTGRNMAPFVELEWGSDAYRLMQEIKAIFDPQQLLNPGVILNTNKHVHLENLKPLPPLDACVDKCIECGFCEPQCPSRDLTLTPRQRIVISREIAGLSARKQLSPAQAQRLKRLQHDYRYQGDDTCAACGLCAMSCPVQINTGDLTRMHRQQQNQQHETKAQWAADHFAGLSQATRLALRSADFLHRSLGTNSMTKLDHLSQKLSQNKLPHWHPYLPSAAARIAPSSDPQHRAGHVTQSAPLKVVYAPSCATRTMGPAKGDAEQRSLSSCTQALLEKAGYQVILPQALNSQCCGMPFQSKGMFEQAKHMQLNFEQVLSDASEQGTIPIIVDTSPCTLKLREHLSQPLAIYDSVEFIERFLIDKLDFKPLKETIALHVTCSTKRMGAEQAIVKLASRCATQVHIPEQISCCGFAGDKGFTTPELNASALKQLQDSLPAGCNTGISNSRTCEIGLSLHSGIHFHSIVYLVDQCTTPKAVSTQLDNDSCTLNDNAKHTNGANP